MHQILERTKTGQFTFIPLDSIMTKGPFERHKTLGQSCRPAIDTLMFDAAHLKALEYVCGDALIVDSMEEGQKIAFSSNAAKGCKIISLDGTVIHKSGMITGGIERNSCSGKRWEEKKLAHLKEIRNKELENLESIAKQRKSLTQEEIQSKIASTAKELAWNTSEIQALQTELAPIHQKIQSLQAEIDSITQSINSIQDIVFQEFCHFLNIPNIRTYESSAANKLVEIDFSLSFGLSLASPA
jgi:structural maintenance of chromosome 1